MLRGWSHAFSGTRAAAQNELKDVARIVPSAEALADDLCR